MGQVALTGFDEWRTILVVAPTWVGDFVMATPLLRAIRGRFRDARIALLIEPNLRELVRGGDWMDECVEWPPRAHRSLLHRDFRTFVRSLRRKPFDSAILLPNSFRSALLALLIGAKRRIGFDRDGRNLLLTDAISVPNRRPGWQENAERAAAEIWGLREAWNAPAVRLGTELPRSLGQYVPMPLVEYYGQLSRALGCGDPGDRLELFTTHECDEGVRRRMESLGAGRADSLVVMSPGAKFGASKCWMPDRFGAVADRLMVERSARVVVTCGPGEEPIARAIAANMKCKPLVFDDPLLSLGELKSLIRRATLWIGNDAGPRHIAKAFGVPAVTVFGSTHPDWTATKHANERIVRVDVDCGPCQQRACPLGHLRCMDLISAETVYSASCDLLDRSKGRPMESIVTRTE